MIRRLKSEITDKDGQLIYAQRKLEALPVNYTTKEREIHRKLHKFCASRETADVELGGVTGASFVNQLLRKGLFSSPAAFPSTLDKHVPTLQNDGDRNRVVQGKQLSVRVDNGR